jgi:transforming growth factor-beta-induced protein
LEMLLKPENKDKLANILKYHVVASKVMAKDVKAGEVETALGKKVTIAVEEGAVTIDGAKVTKTDILCSNGVIHVIDTVILPKE